MKMVFDKIYSISYCMSFQCFILIPFAYAGPKVYKIHFPRDLRNTITNFFGIYFYFLVRVLQINWYSSNFMHHVIEPGNYMRLETSTLAFYGTIKSRLCRPKKNSTKQIHASRKVFIPDITRINYPQSKAKMTDEEEIKGYEYFCRLHLTVYLVSELFYLITFSMITNDIQNYT